MTTPTQLPATGRRTQVLSAATVPPQCRAALELAAARRGFDWQIDQARLFWSTESVPARRGWLRRRDPIVRSVGCLDDQHLAWCLVASGDDHNAMIVRFDQVSVRDGSTLAYGVSARALASTGWDADGIEIRGDLGGSDVGTVFIGVGSDAAALRVREAVLQAAGQTGEV